MSIPYTRGYYHNRTKKMYRVIHEGKMNINGTWVDSITYVPVDSVSNETPHENMDAVFTRNATSFYDDFSPTNERVKPLDQIAQMRAIVLTMPGSALKQRAIDDLWTLHSAAQQVDALEAAIAQHDVDGVVSLILRKIYEKGYAVAHRRQFSQIIKPPAGQPGLDAKVDIITDTLLHRMANRLGWRTFPSYQTTNAIIREYQHFCENERTDEGRAQELLDTISAEALRRC